MIEYLLYPTILNFSRNVCNINEVFTMYQWNKKHWLFNQISITSPCIYVLYHIPYTYGTVLYAIHVWYVPYAYGRTVRVWSYHMCIATKNSYSRLFNFCLNWHLHIAWMHHPYFMNGTQSNGSWKVCVYSCKDSFRRVDSIDRVS